MILRCHHELEQSFGGVPWVVLGEEMSAGHRGGSHVRASLGPLDADVELLAQ
jgi:hypothetical protein